MFQHKESAAHRKMRVERLTKALKKSGASNLEIARARVRAREGDRTFGITGAGKEGKPTFSEEAKANNSPGVFRAEVANERRLILARAAGLNGGGTKFHGTVGDKAPAGVTNHADRMRADTVDATTARERNASFTASILGADGKPKPNALRTTG